MLLQKEKNLMIITFYSIICVQYPNLTRSVQVEHIGVKSST